VEQRYGVKNLFLIIERRITMRGFIVFDKGFGPDYTQEHQEKMQKWLAEGSYTAKLDVTDGIDNAVDALLGIFQGKNFGKAILRIRGE
jgi:NADPH-dependent curcumin reductase CurA